MQEETDRLIREAMEKRSVTIKQGKTRIDAVCGKCGAANRENSFTIKSNCANSLLANRLRNTGVNVPFFSANNAKLHFVPPTSPARITVPPF